MSGINDIIKFFENRKKVKKKGKYTDGYNWAAGELLSGNHNVESIDEYITSVDKNYSFKNGAIEACIDFINLETKIIKSTRVE